ncbi:MAG: methylcobamide--CoM methyltransferase MtbA, partial [Bacteroidetes bacterium]
IIGVAMSPFSLPVMQMGFDKYLDLIFHNKEMFNKLMSINEKFCVDWANAQIEAGATAICYFDPISSPTIIPRKDYLATGFKIAKRTIAQINGPTATHLASGRSLAIMDDLAQTGTAIAGVSSLEDIAELKSVAAGKISLLGNMNGIEMCRWTKAEAEENVKNIIQKAGKGGGLLLGDNHGEIPYQVPEKTLLNIANTVEKWGVYFLKN